MLTSEIAPRDATVSVAGAATVESVDICAPDNAPSNAICRKLGFELLEASEFEFSKGHAMTCNDWRLDLRA
ncbi:MAG: hypothetical protein JO039_11040 [Solirubrobacterales bacterium]|nr:hypothetical protein [Solirubrobacterales bacterium]MBV9798569.1 hypothetical protein [Solirubrobacterales bacterium]